MNLPLIPCRKRSRITDRSQQAHASVSVDASLQLPQLAKNETNTNDELGTKVPASSPSSPIAETVPLRTLQEREISPPLAPVPQSERGQIAEEPHRLRGSDRTRSQTIASNLRLLDEAIRRMSATIDHNLRESGLTRADLLGVMGPSAQRVPTKTLQKDERHSEVAGTSDPTKDGPTDPPARELALRPNSNTMQAMGPAKEVETMQHPTTQVEQERTSPGPVFPNIPRSGRMERMREAKRMLYERWPALAIPANGDVDANSKGKETDKSSGRGVRVERSKRAREDNDENEMAYPVPLLIAKRPRTSPSQEGQARGRKEVSPAVKRNVDEGGAAAVDEKASASDHQATTTLATPKLEWDNVKVGTVQLTLHKVKSEPVEESGVNVELQNDADVGASLKDESSDEVLSTSALLQGRALKNEGSLADPKLRIGK